MWLRFILMPFTLLLVALFVTNAPGDEKDNQAERLREKLDALEKQRSDLTAERRKLEEKLAADMERMQRLEKAQEQHREAVKSLDKAVEEKRAALKSLERSGLDKTVLAEKEKAIKLELDGLLKKIVNLNEENRKLQDEVKKLQDEYRTALNKVEELQQKAKKLVEEYQELAKTLQAANPKAKLVRNPPKESVRGKITAIDAEKGQVTISIGKNAGLEKDHTLEVYRLKPKPVYVGVLRIIEVKKNEAIGKMIAHRPDKPAVDDEVASEISSK